MFMQEFKVYRQINELKELTNNANNYSILEIQNLTQNNIDKSKVLIFL